MNNLTRNSLNVTTTLTLNDIIFSTVIGYGFTQFPKDPSSDVPSTILFILTLIIGIVDWFGNHYFTKTVKDKYSLLFFIIQILTLLFLTQMFDSTSSQGMQRWFLNMGIYLSLYFFWNILTEFNNRTFFISIIIFGSILSYVIFANYCYLPKTILGIGLKCFLTLATALYSLLSIFTYNKITKGKFFDLDRIKYPDYYQRKD